MKKLILLQLFLLLSIGISAQINWVTMEEALAAQKESPKKIMVDMYTVWCGPCKMLDKNTFQNKDLAAYVNENYYAVKFNAEGNTVVDYLGKTFTNPRYDPAKSKTRNYQHQFAGYLRVNAYPTVVFFDEEGGLIAPIPGYRKHNEMELFLKFFKEDAYKTVKSQKEFTEYQRSFVAEFKS
jgi:thioredoxin-related protein